VATDPGHPGALLVVHAWVESGERVVIKLMTADAVDSDALVTRYAGSVPHALALIGEWLDRVTRNGRGAASP
jgi:hypothetical protein